MITNLRAQNFKSWKDTGDLRLAPLTGLFGTNSSGKSSILQVLLMLKQTAESSDPNQVLRLGGPYVDLGTFSDAIHGHKINASISFAVDWVAEDVRYSLKASFREANQQIVASEFTYSGPNAKAGMRARLDGRYEAFVNDQETITDLPATSLFRSRPRELFKSGLSDRFGQALEDLSYLGPLREPPGRSYLSRGYAPRDVGKGGEETIPALLAVQESEPSVEKNVAEWLVKMKLIHSFKLRPIAPNRRDHEVLIKTTEESPEVLFTDVGFGISQLMPVLVLCYYVPEGTTLLIEQPELHLHPSAQSILADVFIDVVKNRKLQIIFESHSEHLLRRVQRRIAEEELPAQDASMYFCHIEKGESHADALQLTEDGFIKNWPENFFGDDMGELAAMTEAAMERKLRQ